MTRPNEHRSDLINHRELTVHERHCVEEFLYAYPYWPFNTRPFVRLGTRFLKPTITRYCDPTEVCAECVPKSDR